MGGYFLAWSENEEKKGGLCKAIIGFFEKSYRHVSGVNQITKLAEHVTTYLPPSNVAL